MEKRLICLILCCVLLLLCGCRTRQSPEGLGEFYEEKELLQNRLITVTVSDPIPKAPVFELSFELRNDSAYPICIDTVVLERQDADGWKLAPVTGRGDTSLQANQPYGICAAYASITLDQRYNEREGNQFSPTYRALTAGNYRIRCSYYQYELLEEIPTTWASAVGYFTVS